TEQTKNQKDQGSKDQQSPTSDDANNLAESSKDGKSASASIGTHDQGVDSISISAKGESPWNLKASRIDYDDVSKKARASSITWNLLDKEGRSLLQLQGDAAVVNTETQGLAFEGPVHAVGPKGEKIVCNKLIWDSKARKIRGSHGVKVVRKGSTMVGQNMVASPDLKHIEVEGDVRIYFNSGLESNQ
ncbi:TPA: LPS export ABC transporter periplasmic protein LptC, partial [bacterium UBP9_UBA11836]|nr:LPS export ABC transporter periplasmic protein LptC [bacterium UBP9_UBA11836]